MAIGGTTTSSGIGDLVLANLSHKVIWAGSNETDAVLMPSDDAYLDNRRAYPFARIFVGCLITVPRTPGAEVSATLDGLALPVAAETEDAIHFAAWENARVVVEWSLIAGYEAVSGFEPYVIEKLTDDTVVAEESLPRTRRTTRRTYYMKPTVTGSDVSFATNSVTATVLASDFKTLDDGEWYVVSNAVACGGLTVSGEVNLILQDGADLFVSNRVEDLPGITVPEGCVLNVYGGLRGTGRVRVYGNGAGAGVGGSGDDLGGCVNVAFYSDLTVGTATNLVACGGSENGAGVRGTLTALGGTILAAGEGTTVSGVDGDVTVYGDVLAALGGKNGICIGGTIDLKTLALVRTGDTLEDSTLRFSTDDTYKKKENRKRGIKIDSKNFSRIGERTLAVVDLKRLVIIGAGEMDDLPDATRWPWFNQAQDITNAVVAGSLENIGRTVFAGLGNLVSVEIMVSNSLERIGAYAFADCHKLGRIDFSACTNLASIGEHAFDKCGGLTDCRLPPSVKTLGADAFYYCWSLPRIDLPDALATLGYEAFAACDALGTVTFSSNVTEVADFAFDGCVSLTNLSILAETPPRAYADTFHNVPDKDDGSWLCVPAGCVEAYEKDSIWKRFIVLNASDANGVVNLVLDKTGRVDASTMENGAFKVVTPDGKGDLTPFVRLNAAQDGTGYVIMNPEIDWEGEAVRNSTAIGESEDEPAFETVREGDVMKVTVSLPKPVPTAHYQLLASTDLSFPEGKTESIAAGYAPPTGPLVLTGETAHVENCFFRTQIIEE